MSDLQVQSRKKQGHFWLDFGPLLLFFGAFLYFKRENPDQAMVWAAGVLGVAAILATGVAWLKHRYLSGILILSTCLVVFFAALTFFTGNKTFLFMKPTIVNLFFASAVFGGVFLGKNIIKVIMGGAFEMSTDKWNVMAIRWGCFFVALAVVNEIVWRNFSEQFWVNFKVFGFLPLTFLFTLSQVPFIRKHGKMRGAGETD
ncbi:MAG: septation protein IspZ [Hyphomonadaceae bacterium]|nr:septation protein IspZ [Hyphomonadaceae bacterium]MBC6412477.1 septation protein IspZ [Hyphomonadaceae bacterium]